MKLPLRKARKLESKLAKTINGGFVTYKDISMFDPVFMMISPPGAIKEADVLMKTTALECSERAEYIERVISARSTIRRLIQKQNEAMGLNDLINRRLEVISQVTLYNNIIRDYDEANNKNVTGKMLIGMRENKMERENASSYVSGTLRVMTISETTYNSTKFQLSSAHFELEKIEDELAGLNSTATITIDQEVLHILKAEGLIR